jgi:molybdenum cofactor cytidylyltransferase
MLIAILAAGASRRLGTPKQLVQIADEPLLRRQCRVALSAGVGPVAAILGCDADRCAPAIEDLGVDIRVNDDWREGMAASLRHAVGVADEVEAPAVLVLGCDQYRITAADLRTLHDAWRQSPSSACVSRWDDYTGPPVVLPVEWYDRVRQLRGDRGACRILYDPSKPPPIEVTSPHAPYDLDSPEDLLVAQNASGAP